jgi:predicted RNA-binding Zn-ribbon protein involved in translation (DUF1610 family)
MPTTMILNGRVTQEMCPECNYPYPVRVEHGRSKSGTNMHHWHCPECGDSMVLVCYDCPDCQEPQE